MRKTFTLLIALMALTVSTWATPTTITWNSENGLTSIDLNEYTNNYWENEYHSYSGAKTAIIEGIAATISATADGSSASFYTYSGTSINISSDATLTFRSGVYEIQSIVINYTGSGYATGWISEPNTLTWTGSATHSVEMTNAYVSGITDIVFTVEAVSTNSVTWDQDDIATISLTSSTQGDTQTASAIKGITASLTRTSGPADEYDHCQFTYSEPWISNSGDLKFTSSVGDIVSIVITCDQAWSHDNLSAGWAYKDGDPKTYTWIGDAASEVTLSGYVDFSATSIEFIIDASAPAPAISTITWDQTDVASVSVWSSSGSDPESQTVNTISVTAATSASEDYSQFTTYDNSSYISIDHNGTLTFAPASGKLTRIVVECSSYPSYPEKVSDGWSWNGDTYKLTWTGEATSAVLACTDATGYIYFGGITSVEFTVVEEASTPVVPDPTPALASLTWKPENGLTSINLLEYTNYAFGGDPESTQDETSATIGGVTATISAANDGQYAQFNTSPGYGGTHFSLENGATLTFSAASGQFERIVIYFESGQTVSNLEDWESDYNVDPYTVTWSGTPANSVVLTNVSAFEIDSIVFTIAGAASADPTPAGPNFTWQTQQINHVSLYTSSVDETQTTPVIKNIITSITRTDANDNCQFRNGQIEMNDNGTMTFQSIVGDITGIVINCNVLYYNTAEDLPADWTYNSLAGTLTWSGTAAESVTLSGTLNLTLSSIQFFYTPADAPYLGDEFYGYNNHTFKVTGPKTVSMPSQYLGGTLMIPSTVEYMGDTYYVTEIEDYAFSGQVSAANVMSYGNDGGKHLAKIGAHAFDGCIRMDEVSLNSTVLDTIGDAAFKNCKLMTIFELWTEEPPVLGTDAFYGDTYLNHVNVETYSVDAYQAATGWSAYASMIAAMYSLPSVGEQFFFHNQMTTGIYQVTYASNTRKEAKVLPYNAEVNAIYPTTFEGTLVIPEEADYIHNSYSVTGIGANAYKDSTRFNMVLLPQGVKTIESGAFLNCTGVEKVFFLWDDPTAVTWADATVGAEFKTAASHGTQIFVPQGRLAAYQAWAPAWADCMFEGELFDVTASQDPNNNLRHYCTFYDSTTDYMLPPSVWANVGVVSGGEFRIWPIKFDGEILPRGTAVVLESETPTYRLIPTGNTEPLYTGPNDLIGTDVTIPRTSVGNNGENVYVLGKQAQMNEELHMGMGLYKYTGANLGAHKAYMIYDAPSGPNSAPIRFLFKQEDQATGVENVQSDKVQCTKVIRDGQLIIIKDGKEYNAQGQTIK
ncbi:MAG: leucine-rich repeat protein [Paludibacteraceae bacterium]|nr:leucine-rich repeat protein [Paludibacteraceae bacterium]MBQ2521068.1 leucine-rich repeat protein [Paludibacteraceae bacterium]